METSIKIFSSSVFEPVISIHPDDIAGCSQHFKGKKEARPVEHLLESILILFFQVM